MISSAHFSDQFIHLLDIWPKCYLGFPTPQVRGNALCKSYIILENVTQTFVIFRIAQDRNCTLDLRCKPGIGVLMPGCIQRIEVLIKSERPCNLSDQIYVEAIAYHGQQSDPKIKEESLFTLEKVNEYLKDKSMEYFCLKCYQTNTIALVPMEEQLFRIEQRLKSIERVLKNYGFWFFLRTWTLPIVFTVIIVLFTLINIWTNQKSV